MSNPLASLKKVKKPPLILPEMSKTPILASSTLNSSRRSSLNKATDPKDLDLAASGNSSSPFTSISSLNSIYSQSTTSRNKYWTNNFQNLPNPISSSDITSSRVPFKTKIDDSDLLDDVTTQMAITNMKKNYGLSANTATVAVSDRTPNDMELMQIMMSKIKRTEAKCAALEKECYSKDKRIKILEEKLEIYQKINDESNDELIEELELNNLSLREKIYEMEKFLAEYGLYWVGDKDKKDDDENLIDVSNGTEKISNKENFHCNYDLIIKNINELNSLTDYNESKIVDFTNNGATFKTNESIKLTLYVNGIALFNGPFRPFSNSLTRKFCIDIMDGYFPSELQSRYPDGIPFNVIDKRDTFFKEESNSVFKSKGYRLGSARVQSSQLNDEIPNNSLASNTIDAISSKEELKNIDYKKIESQLTETPLSVEQFLSKLPGSVIHNGKMIDIRNDLSSLITGNNNNNEKASVTIIETPVFKELKQKNSHLETHDDELLKITEIQGTKLATLRVKPVNSNENTYLLKMKYTDTILDLKEIIKEQRKRKFIEEDFDLASIHPRKTFENLNMTLEESHLVPNSNIILIPHKN